MELLAWRSKLLNVNTFSPAMLAIALCIAAQARAKEVVAPTSINEDKGYHSATAGDPFAEQGAQVTISGRQGATAPFGGVSYKTGSQRWVGKVAHLSAVLKATDSDAKAAIWLRADGSSGVLKYTSSARLLRPADGRINVDLRIPPDAVRLAFGVTLAGSGEATVDGLRLTQSNRVLPGGGASATQVYEAATKIVFEHAYHAENLGESHRDLKPKLSVDPGTGYQAEENIRTLLSELKDSHSFYQDAEDASRYSSSGGDPAAAKVMLIEGKVGYVSIPAVNGTNAALAKSFADEVGGKLKGTSRDARCGWVVDLRNNRGGNMWPMISALSSFFGTERLGGFKRADGQVAWWSLQTKKVTAAPGRSEAKDAKVAVLLGPRTASSGEAVAVAFVDRPNTRSFGAPTAGLASSNTRFTLPDGGAIYLTTAIDVDRTGREVGQKIAPDERLADDIVEDSEIPAAALAWLTNSCPQ